MRYRVAEPPARRPQAAHAVPYGGYFIFEGFLAVCLGGVQRALLHPATPRHTSPRPAAPSRTLGKSLSPSHYPEAGVAVVTLVARSAPGGKTFREVLGDALPEAYREILKVFLKVFRVVFHEVFHKVFWKARSASCSVR